MPQGHKEGKSAAALQKYDSGALIALGSNLTSSAGTPLETLRKAVEMLQKRGAVIRAVSRYYTTPAFPGESGPDFVNAVASLGSAWTAHQLLSHLHTVEAKLGRVRTVRWGQRAVDLDLLALDDLVLPNPQTHARWRNMPLAEQMRRVPDDLIVPHPRMQDRAFVLVPLCDVAPDWVHPVLGRTARQLCGALPQSDRSAVRLLE